MPNVSEKKRKLFCLLKILLEKTDGEHSLTLPQLLEELKGYGITAERKSIYDDVETLRACGFAVQTRKSRTFEYYLGERRFSVEELALLADAVRTAPFLTEKRGEELVEKLAGLCSDYQKKLLERPVSVSGRRGLGRKTMARLELLHRAMVEKKQVSFRLAEWRVSESGKPEHVVRKHNKTLTVSPVRILWTGARYELLAYDAHGEKLKRFPLGNMAELELLEEEAAGKRSAEEKAEHDGKEKLTLEFSADLLEEIVERFGQEIRLEPCGKNRLRAVVRGAPDRELFGWLFSLGTEIRLVSPRKAAEQVRERAKAVGKLYKNEK